MQYGKYLKQPKDKRGTKAAKEHLKKVKSLSCCMCGAAPPSDAHHIRDLEVGAGQKSSDFETIPLCKGCHQGDNGFHGLGRKEWERRYQVTQRELLKNTRKLLTQV